MLRLLVAMLLLLAAVSAVGAAELRPAKLLEAESYNERQTTGAIIKGNGGIYSLNHDMNRITVSLDGMKITAVFEAHWSWSTKASGLVIGTEVQAMAEKDKLVVVTPEGKTIKAKIVRRELESPAMQSGGNAEGSKTKDSGTGHMAERTDDIVRRTP